MRRRGAQQARCSAGAGMQLRDGHKRQAMLCNLIQPPPPLLALLQNELRDPSILENDPSGTRRLRNNGRNAICEETKASRLLLRAARM